ncbi:PTS glucose transporter subunit IIA [Oenococcus oeni]|uniref:PTS glucose transporter subunit IIA n=1 Tax=Oenococcus oeni TaxID=1247 RepID=UPI0030CBC3C2
MYPLRQNRIRLWPLPALQVVANQQYFNYLNVFISLIGEPFKLFVKVGDIVSGGDKVAEVDWSEIKKAGFPLTTMVLITNSKDLLDDFSVDYGVSDHGESIGWAKSK